MNTDTLAFRAHEMGDLWMGPGNDTVASPDPALSLANAIALSTAFPQHPTDDAAGPDLCLLSSDNVHFYVHRVVLAVSDNAFGGLLSRTSPSLAEDTPPVMPVSVSSAVLNLILHIIYRKPLQDHKLSVHDVLAAVEGLEHHGIPVLPHLMPAGQLSTLLLFYAPLRPMDVYTTAAQYDVYALASAASAYLHNYSIVDISDGLVLKMGAMYLKRLAELFENRMDTLRGLVLSPPPFHETTFQCGYTARDKLVSGWTYAVTELTWDASPGLSPARIRSVFELHESDVACSDCRARYKAQVKSMLLKWSMAQRTI